MAEVKRALISVSDKSGVAELANGLSELGIGIISTGGTAKILREKGIQVKEVSDITGFPEMLDGRVKTLHPKIHAGILALRSKKEHLEQLAKHGIEGIDLVIVNLYPFEQIISKKVFRHEDAVENIDIGGPTLIRAAAKNYESIGVVVDPADYPEVLKELRENKSLALQTRERLATKAFQHTARYDALIGGYFEKKFGGEMFPRFLTLSFEKEMDLRYGENPHQKASFYRESESDEASISKAKKLQGREISYNNMLDADSALELLKEFEEPAVVIVKHNSPCGVAVNKNLKDAYLKAKATDPEAAFGGVVALNRTVDGGTAEQIISVLTDVVVAPHYSREALEIFSKKKNMRVLEVGSFSTKKNERRELRSINGGLLVEERNTKLLIGEPKVVTKRKPTEAEMKALLFAWEVCKHVKSNAIVYSFEDRTVGIGAGQMKRSDASKLGAMKAVESLRGAVLASDAFFPFRDAVDIAAKAGVTAIIQPGGSKNDQQVIDACNEHNIAMVFTGIRHFRH
ncbi:MAG: bifunctional phosphoribosylaminoimidazolecarboxamide formyltransferase/IMP cyclohydrolase [Candidatus Micrarchaeota archaeon]|nr:bifunctional phosphoribosylaminoimidazolecarboxamide formyltransferase/IMP cyclohydrolase [Candidatus Micrarchaeota archaeon]